MKLLVPAAAALNLYGHDILREGVLHLPASEEGVTPLRGATHQDPKPFTTVTLNAAGRLLSRADVIQRWFEQQFEEYACLLAEHVAQVGWMDIVSIATPLRLDRLCLSLVAQEGGSYLAWTWAGARQGWTAAEPFETERRIVLEPPIALKAFVSGHLIKRRERAGMIEVTPSQRRPQWRYRPELRLTPYSSHTLIRQEGLVHQYAAFTAPQAPTQEERSKQTMTLPDGRLVELVDWEDPKAPLGRRVQSKVLTQMEVNLTTGELWWADAQTLARYPSKGARSPGAPVKAIHVTTQFGRFVFGPPQMMWAYWTGEMPADVRQWTNNLEHMEYGTHLNGLENVAGIGWKAGSEKERDELAGPDRNGGALEWRDAYGRRNGVERSFILEAKKTKAQRMRELESNLKLSPANAIAKSRIHVEEFGEIFAKKCLKGELSPQLAYERAFILHKNSGDWIKQEALYNEDLKSMTAKPSEHRKERYNWLHDHERMQLEKSARLSGTLLPGSPTLTNRKEKYRDFPELYVSMDEWRHFFIQQGFKKFLNLEPQEYGQARVDIFELMEARRS